MLEPLTHFTAGDTCFIWKNVIWEVVISSCGGKCNHLLRSSHSFTFKEVLSGQSDTTFCFLAKSKSVILPNTPETHYNNRCCCCRRFFLFSQHLTTGPEHRSHCRPNADCQGDKTALHHCRMASENLFGCAQVKHRAYEFVCLACLACLACLLSGSDAAV